MAFCIKFWMAIVKVEYKHTLYHTFRKRRLQTLAD